MRRSRGIGVALVATILAAAPLARADDEAAPTPEMLKAAADEFDRGRRAYLAREFEQAAVHFENAFRDAPRAETLRLAIRARREAKHTARAATLAAVAERRYAADPTTSELARETLAALAPELHEVQIECAPECAVTADGRVVSNTDQRQHRLYLEPGLHELGVSFPAGGSVARRVQAERGAKDTLAFEPPKAPDVAPVPVPVPVAPPPPGAEVAPPSGKPFGPAVVLVGAGIAVAAGAATIVSGLDAQKNPGVEAVRRECAGRDESCPLYREGKDAELRTNVLLGVAVGAAVLTGVVALFLTDWRGSRPALPNASVGAAPIPGGGTVGLSARF
jgi:hypothetical protein